MTALTSLRPRSGTRRRSVILLELTTAAAICFLGYSFGARWLQEHEARWVADALRLIGRDDVSGVLPGHILIFAAHHSVLNAEVTTSCSSLLSILGLTALTVAVFRHRRQNALGGLLVACVALVVLNGVRLTLSTLAGIWWGRPAMILFHDWVGSLWNFAATFLGFLILVAITLHTPERAEQDANGRHTAGRPSSWARPGLGYQMTEAEFDGARRRRGLTGFFYRYVLPRGISARLGRRREAGRIDYRIGHLTPEDRVLRVQELAADGLGAHTASLLAVATYDQDSRVLDALAREVAARQWEPVTSDRMSSLRLWARGWLMARGVRAPMAAAGPGAEKIPPRPGGPAAEDPYATRSLGEVVLALRPPVPRGPSPSGGALPMTSPLPPPGAPRAGDVRAVRPRPRSFALARPDRPHAPAEDPR